MIPLSLKGDDIITTKTAHFNQAFVQEDIRIDDKTMHCPECDSTDLFFDSERAEISCNRCGIVIDESLIDQGPEWRAFNPEQRAQRTRTGAPLTLTIADKGLRTFMGSNNLDSNGRMFPERNRAQIHRMRKWDKRARVSSAGERNLAIALSDIDRLASRLGVPRSVREDASSIYRNAAKKNIVRGRSIDSVAAASLYIACRRCNIPRTLEEVSEASNISKKQIGKNHRFLARELNIKLQPTSPRDYISRFASKLGLSGMVQAKAIDIIDLSFKNGLNVGKGPAGIAAAALYIASILLCEKKTQKDVSVIAGVTEVTIRNRYKELVEKLDMVV